MNNIKIMYSNRAVDLATINDNLDIIEWWLKFCQIDTSNKFLYDKAIEIALSNNNYRILNWFNSNRSEIERLSGKKMPIINMPVEPVIPVIAHSPYYPYSPYSPYYPYHPLPIIPIPLPIFPIFGPRHRRRRW
jgi:hypothetical protein